MSMKEKLKWISKTKLEVSFLQNEYNCDIAQAEKMKELGLVATSEKCLKAAEETYQEIQKELSEYLKYTGGQLAIQ